MRRCAPLGLLLVLVMVALLPAAEAGFLVRLVDCTRGDGTSCYDASSGAAVPPLTAPTTITLRVFVGGGLDGSCPPTTVDWGDGSAKESNNAPTQHDYTHTYEGAGTFYIRVTNACTGMGSGGPIEVDISPGGASLGAFSLDLDTVGGTFAALGTVLALAGLALSLAPVRGFGAVSPSVRASQGRVPRHERVPGPFGGFEASPPVPAPTPSPPPQLAETTFTPDQPSPIAPSPEAQPVTGGGAFQGPPDYWSIPGAQPPPSGPDDPRKLVCPEHGLPLRPAKRPYGSTSSWRWVCPVTAADGQPHLTWG